MSQQPEGIQPIVEKLAQESRETQAIWKAIGAYLDKIVGDQQWRFIAGHALKEGAWTLALIPPKEGSPARWLFVEQDSKGFSAVYF